MALVECGHPGAVCNRHHATLALRDQGPQALVQGGFGSFVQRAGGFIGKYPFRFLQQHAGK